MSGRVDVHNDYLMSLSLPKVKAGCGGIDMFLGGMSFLDPDYLVQKLESILQAAPAVAFQYLLETLDEKMGNIISKMEAATNFLNSIQVNDCRLRSEEHTSELQSLMRISSAVFCLKKKNTPLHTKTNSLTT